MLKRYCIWDKVSPVITPSGEVFTAEEWMTRYPVASIPTITIVGSAGEINGGFFGTLGQMKQMWEAQGVEFEDGLSDEEVLEAIEAYEEGMNNRRENFVTPEERIAAALEAQVMMSLPDDMWDEELTEEE